MPTKTKTDHNKLCDELDEIDELEQEVIFRRDNLLRKRGWQLM
jgi:hypothetical protein